MTGLCENRPHLIRTRYILKHVSVVKLIQPSTHNIHNIDHFSLLKCNETSDLNLGDVYLSYI